MSRGWRHFPRESCVKWSSKQKIKRKTSKYRLEAPADTGCRDSQGGLLPPVGVYSPREGNRRFKETASPFRRNAITVPAQRHHRSGETAPPFRRNGITVSRHLNPVSGMPDGRNGGGHPGRPVFLGDILLFHDEFKPKTQTNGHFHACRRSVLVPMRIFSHRHENIFSWA